MKAAWYERNGAARDVLTVGDMPLPEPGPGEVRVRLKTSGVNPSDVKSRRGRPLAFPRIVPHSDGAGVIEAVGDGVAASRIGERVWIWNGQWKRAIGTAAEAIAVPEAQAVRLPDGTDFDAGACFGIPALTAIHGVTLAEAAPGRTILITGAAAAVGPYATQVAAEIVDYQRENVAERVKELTGGKGVDAILDMDLATTAPLLPQGVLAPYGKLVCYGSNQPTDIPVSFTAMLWSSLTLQLYLVYELRPEERAKAIADLTAMLEAGSLTHTIGARFALADIVAAHEAVESGDVVGNVVLDVE